MIIIDKLKKNFGEKIAVDIEHYEINQGDMLGLVGNNGAGKTTLFRIMLDLLKADDGKVIINDIDVSQSEDWKSITGAFIDYCFLIDYLTPEEYFYFNFGAVDRGGEYKQLTVDPAWANLADDEAKEDNAPLSYLFMRMVFRIF